MLPFLLMFFHENASKKYIRFVQELFYVIFFKKIESISFEMNCSILKNGLTKFL
jgi:hypothetical protein